MTLDWFTWFARWVEWLCHSRTHERPVPHAPPLAYTSPLTADVVAAEHWTLARATTR